MMQKPDDETTPRSLWTALRRGFRGRCPSCGERGLWRSYVKVADHCTICGEALYHHRADDMPPYVTILLVGHLMGPMVWFVEQNWAPDTWVHWLAWLPLALILCLFLLPRVKGAVVGLQWANRMHGFGDGQDQPIEA